MRTSIRVATAVCTALALPFSISWAAETAAVQHDLQIERQPLDLALQEFATQSGIQIVFLSKLTEAIEAPALSGRYTATAALEQLLQGSQLTFRQLNPKTIAIEPATPAATDGAAVGQPPAEGEASFLLEEVMVTAQKRTEKMQDVPSSISVIGGQQIETFSALHLADYAAYVPGFTATSGGTPGQVSLTLRGISSLGPATQVGTYLDETPVGSSAAWARESSLSLDLLPYDIERVEVLRGPQGTLYGANSMGGLLKYVLRQPELNAFSATVGTEAVHIRGADDIGDENVRVSVNVPVVDGKLALRASLLRQETPGYIDNPHTDTDDENSAVQEGARLAVLWQAHEDVAVKLQAVVQKIDSKNNASVRRDLDVSGGPGNIRVLGPSAGELSYAHVLSQPFEKEIQYFAATLDWDLDFGTFTSASSYSLLDTRQGNDFSPTFGPLIALFSEGAVADGRSLMTVDLDLRRYTQELRLASLTGGRFEWLIGAYYSDESSDNHQVATAWDALQQPIPGVHPLAVADLPATYQEIAAFMNTTFKLNDRFDLTIGVRWARNEQWFHQTLSGPLVGGSTDGIGTSEESVFTYAVSPRFHLSRDVMLYARLASGYRPGGPNVTFPGIPPQNDADRTINIEAGIKSELWNRRALLNAAVYRIDWKDMQLNAVFGGIGAVVNGKSARSQGFELETAYSPVRGIRLGLTAAYTDAQITADMVQGQSIDWRDGDRLPYAPKWSGALTASSEFALTGSWSGSVNGGLRYSGSQFNAVEGDALNTRLGGYAVVDLALAATNDRWRLRLFAKNVLDRRAYTSTAIITAPDNTSLYAVSQVIQPRTIGIGADVNF